MVNYMFMKYFDWKDFFNIKNNIFCKVWKICFIDKNIICILDKYKENNWVNSINNLVYIIKLCFYYFLGGNFNKFI